jgi:hypothetical protein
VGGTLADEEAEVLERLLEEERAIEANADFTEAQKQEMRADVGVRRRAHLNNIERRIMAEAAPELSPNLNVPRGELDERQLRVLDALERGEIYHTPSLGLGSPGGRARSIQSFGDEDLVGSLVLGYGDPETAQIFRYELDIENIYVQRMGEGVNVDDVIASGEYDAILKPDGEIVVLDRTRATEVEQVQLFTGTGEPIGAPTLSPNARLMRENEEVAEGWSAIMGTRRGNGTFSFWFSSRRDVLDNFDAFADHMRRRIDDAVEAGENA